MYMFILEPHTSMHVYVVCMCVARGSRITPVPNEKAQASDGICKRAAHLGSKLNQKNVVLDAPVRVYACMYAYVCEMNVRRQVSNQHAQVIYNNLTHACTCVSAA